MTHIICTKLVEGFGDLNLLGRIKVGVCKLLPFSQCALDYLETRNVAEEIADRLIWVPAAGVGILSRVNAGITWVAFT
jgi:hypothetical protein